MLAFNRTRCSPSESDLDLLPDVVPWADEAVLLKRLGRHNQTIAATGSLYAVVQRLQSISDRDWSSYTVSLPDRRSLPLMYFPKHFGALLRRSYWTKIQDAG